MQAFLRNIPQNLSEESLREELTPIMNELSILDWHCSKPRHKKFSFITFLVKEDGKRFLDKHQSRARAPRLHNVSPSASRNSQFSSKEARLHLLRTAVFVEPGNRDPPQNEIDHLRHQRAERSKPRAEPKAPRLTCKCIQISCGHNMFLKNQDTPVFVEQTRLLGHTNVKFGRRFLGIHGLDFLINISHHTVESWILSPSNVTLTLVLREPPRFYVHQSFQSPYEEVHIRLNQIDMKRERRTTLPSWSNHARYVATCRVYQLRFLREDYKDILATLESVETVSLIPYDIGTISTPSSITQDYPSAYQVFEKQMETIHRYGYVVPFAICFQIQALVWNTYLHPATASKFLSLIWEAFNKARHGTSIFPVTVASMRHLFDRIPYVYPGVDATELEAQRLFDTVLTFESELRHESPSLNSIYGASVPTNQVPVFKATVTPTSILLEGPEPESLNRVLRMFAEQSDHFLRVTFCDEDGQDPQYNANVSNEPIYDRYRKVLHEGIKIAGRRFNFLGFSHSSLRSHSAWFSSPFEDNNRVMQHRDTILESLGSFGHIRNPAKCAARIGQAFSETPYAVSLKECGIRVEYIPDIKSADGTRIFSDGVGTLSQEAMEEIWMHLPWRSGAATCFQIRLGGIKGMLSLDVRIPGRVIRIRKESMMKFPSNNMDELGICDTASKPMRLFLNRQMIKIMEDMGTQLEWFLNQQQAAIDTLKMAVTEANKTGSFLEKQSIGMNMGFPWFIRHLNKLGISFQSDRFLRSIVEHAVLRELRLLKSKARIPVTQGVTLFGVMDEFAFLKEGEIYVAYDEKHYIFSSQPSARLCDGTVLVTRSPALHPGDVRLVKHVTPPDGHPLRSLRNCIVFSQKGHRDLPSQLSGGDLDGDLFNVLWDSSGLPIRNFPPADYPRVVSEELRREVRREDIEDFFINFMKNDILGLIAVRHVVMADVEEEGACAWLCKKLAELHSSAVDYSKTGRPVALSEVPKAPRTRPDFMAPIAPVKLLDAGQTRYLMEVDSDADEHDEEGLGRKRPRYHRSDKVLGKLYRAIDEKDIWNKEMQTKLSVEPHGIWPQVLKIVQTRVRQVDIRMNSEDKMQQAQKIQDLYERSVRDLMWQFSENPNKQLSEQEVFCGSISGGRNGQTKRQRESSIKLREEMNRVSAWIVRMIRGLERTDDSSSSISPESVQLPELSRREEAIQLSYACLISGISPERRKTKWRRGERELHSFSVVAACCLLKEVDELTKLKQVRHGAGGRQTGRRNIATDFFVC